MTFGEFLTTLRKRWIYVVAPFLLSTVVVGIWSMLSQPIFTARASAYFSIQAGQTPSELFQGSNYTQQQVNSYALLATKPIVLEPVIRELELSTTTRELARSIDAEASADSVIVDVEASDPTPAQAARIANAVVDQLGDVVRDLSPELRGQPSVEVTAVAVAVPPQVQSFPNTRLFVLVAGLAGLFVGILAGLARQHLDTRLRAGEHLPGGIGVLGTVEYDRDARQQPLRVFGGTGTRQQQVARESFRRIRTNLKFLDVDRPVKVVVVTSSVAAEGKTSVSINLAEALAEDGIRVVLVDADLRRPKVAEYLALDSGVGLADVLTNQVSLEDALQRWTRSNQFVLPTGAVPPNPAELLDSDAMAKLTEELRRQFDVVVLDLPPLLPVTDAAVAATLADGAIVVVRHGRTTKRQYKTAIESLRAVKARVLGSVMNRAPGPRPWSRRRSAYEYYSTSADTRSAAAVEERSSWG